MDHTVLVGFGEPIGNLYRDGDDLTNRRNPGSKKLTQRLSFDEFEDKKIHPIMVADVMQSANIGVGELGDSTSFVLEAMAKMGILGKMFRQNLDSDFTAQPRITGTIHLSHAARADDGQDFVRA